MLRKKRRKKLGRKSRGMLVFLVLLFFVAALLVPLLYLKNRADDLFSKPEESKISAKEFVYGEFSGMTIELDYGDKKEIIDSDRIIDWLDISEKDDKIVCKPDDDMIADYVKSLAEKTDTFVEKIPFTARSGKKMKILNKSSGWMLDKDKSCEKLKEMIKNKRSVVVDLTDGSDESNSWWFRIAGDYGVGHTKADTYAEVSLSDQYMWMIKDKKVVFESPIVSGNPNTGHETPKGAFILYEKKKNAELYSEEYNTTVDWWMAFCDDVGFHDAVWQESFGGEVYLYNGSHGCVNLPLDAAEELYSISYVGLPVFVY